MAEEPNLNEAILKVEDAHTFIGHHHILQGLSFEARADAVTVLIGRNGAGKGEVVGYLADRSFYGLSLSDVIRDELEKQGLEPTRERMLEAGTAMRAERGPGALALGLIDRLLPDRNYAIDSIRHPAEVEALRESGHGFHLVWVEAPVEVRFERMKARGRKGDLDFFLAAQGPEHNGRLDAASGSAYRARAWARLPSMKSTRT